MRKTVVGLLLLCAALLGATPLLARDKPITIAVEDDWAPYSSLKKDRSGPEGFTVDVVREIYKAKGIGVHLVAVPYARCLNMTDTGAAIACLHTPKVRENIDKYWWHETPVVDVDYFVYGLAGETSGISNTQALEGQSVGITHGYTYPSDFTDNQKINKVPYRSEELLLKMLVNKRIRYIVVSEPPIAALAKSHSPWLAQIKKLGALERLPHYLNFSKKDPRSQELLQVFEAGLKELKKSGQYDKRLTKLRKEAGLSY